jgi:glycosyltransferase involved in cell wall biosynthesis
MDSLKNPEQNIDQAFELSIVIPVHNGGAYLKEFFKTIYNQTLQPTEIVILENSSTDDTVAWLKSLNDPRIKIYPTASLLPIEQNWDRIKTIPRKKWMFMSGHDDLLKPGFLETIKRLTEKHPAASLYQTHFDIIDGNGAVTSNCDPMPETQTMPEFFENTLNNGGGFVMRSADYDKVGGIPMYPGFFFTDFALWMKLTALSYKATAAENLFSYRHHQQNTSSNSSVISFSNGLDAFMDYLYELKQADETFRKTLNTHAEKLVQLYVKSLSHRLLREDIKKRNNYTVKQLVNKFQTKLNRLTDDPSGNLSSDVTVKIAMLIDSNNFTRKMFLLFKKLFPKPVLKN